MLYGNGLSCGQEGYIYFYEVQRGDSLNKIIKDFYCEAKDKAILEKIKTKILKMNGINNANLIYANSTIALEVPFREEVNISERQAIMSMRKDLNSLDPKEKEIFQSIEESGLDKMVKMTGTTATFSSAALSSYKIRVSANIDNYRKMAKNYESFALDKISKTQYMAKRAELINKVSHLKRSAVNITPAKGRAFRKVLKQFPKSKSFVFSQQVAKNVKLAKSLKNAPIVGVAADVGVAAIDLVQSEGALAKMKAIAGGFGSYYGGVAGAKIGTVVGGFAIAGVALFTGVAITATGSAVILFIAAGAGAVYGSKYLAELSKTAVELSAQGLELIEIF